NDERVLRDSLRVRFRLWSRERTGILSSRRVDQAENILALRFGVEEDQAGGAAIDRCIRDHADSHAFRRAISRQDGIWDLSSYKEMRSFFSLHRDEFDYCGSALNKLIVCPTSISALFYLATDPGDPATVQKVREQSVKPSFELFRVAV